MAPSVRRGALHVAPHVSALSTHERCRSFAAGAIGAAGSEPCDGSAWFRPCGGGRTGYVLNRDGEPYEFVARGTDAGGDSAGCVDVDGDGKLELVGLHYQRSGDEVRWTRTVVQLRNGWAENGAVETGVLRSPRDHDKIDVQKSVSCGDKVDTGA